VLGASAVYICRSLYVRVTRAHTHTYTHTQACSRAHRTCQLHGHEAVAVLWRRQVHSGPDERERHRVFRTGDFDHELARRRVRECPVDLRLETAQGVRGACAEHPGEIASAGRQACTREWAGGVGGNTRVSGLINRSWELVHVCAQCVKERSRCAALTLDGRLRLPCAWLLPFLKEGWRAGRLFPHRSTLSRPAHCH
jgi:hypothetical protein